MEVTAKLRGAAISAQKARLVADLIRGKSVARALDILNFSNKKAAVLGSIFLSLHSAACSLMASGGLFILGPLLCSVNGAQK